MNDVLRIAVIVGLVLIVVALVLVLVNRRDIANQVLLAGLTVGVVSLSVAYLT